MNIVKKVDVEEVEEMQNKLKLFGIDTSLDQSPTLTIGINTKENYHQLFRVLKRLTINQEISLKFAKGLFHAFAKWKNKEFSNEEDFKELSIEDKDQISTILEFEKRKITPNKSVIKGTTLLTVYDGSAYRQRRIYVGEMRKAVKLPSGEQIKKIILVSKEVAIFLNWLVAHFPFKVEASWKSIYRGGTDQSYFGVICHFITNKLDHMNAQYHREPLDEIFNQFYLDYMVSYSGVMQKRVDEKLRSESVATAYLTKKTFQRKF